MPWAVPELSRTFFYHSADAPSPRLTQRNGCQGLRTKQSRAKSSTLTKRHKKMDDLCYLDLDQQLVHVWTLPAICTYMSMRVMATHMKGNRR